MELEEVIKKMVAEQIKTAVNETVKQATESAIVNLHENKQFLDKEDIAKMFDCGNNKAQQIIREIKSVSNILKLQGKVLPEDYNNWKNYRKQFEVRV